MDIDNLFSGSMPLNRMAAMSIYGKKKKKKKKKTVKKTIQVFFSKKALRLNFCILHQTLIVYQVYLDDDPRMTLALFQVRSNFRVHTKC